MAPKRPRSGSSELPEAACLSFQDWEARRVGGPSGDRSFEDVYSPSEEKLPDSPWYTLDHNDIGRRVSQMCSKLLRIMRRYVSVNGAIAELVDDLRSATATPAPTKFNIAVVGDQGIGKSSLINALLHRDLVDVSASSSACTAYATILRYKEGASDSTTKSDITVQFLDETEIRDFVEEQIRRYTDVYNPVIPDDALSEDEDNATDDSSEYESVIHQTYLKSGKRKVSDALQRGADTAKTFFRIIFAVDNNVNALRDLENWLQDPDLEDGRFLNRCVDVALDHIAKIHATEGNVVYEDVSDDELQTHREFAATIWPLVRSLTISTGSILLRNGICFLDLPGYGDLNQTRTAVVNEFRREANFEMVVAKSERYLSSTIQDRYLTRAIRQHEGKNTILVLNKADSFLSTDANQTLKLINTLKEEPFLSLNASLLNLPKSNPATAALIRSYKRYVIKEAQLAYIKREAGHVRQQMLVKGVKVFSVSAGQYMTWKDPERLADPLCEPDVSGIPMLRNYLLTLPAEANYEDLREHIFETLPDIEDHVDSIVANFDDDDAYNELRAYLAQSIPALTLKLRDMSNGTPNTLIQGLWTDIEKASIARKLQTLVDSWRPPKIRFSTFAKMLRENGIPQSGKAHGRNLNEEILRQYKMQLHRWKDDMILRSEELGTQLNEPVQSLLQAIQSRFDQTPADPDYKIRANEALKKSVQRTAIAQGRLYLSLASSVRETYLRFATEDDKRCPIAKAMKLIYRRIAQMNIGQKNRSQFMREELARSITETTDEEVSVIDAMQSQILDQQVKAWQADCKTFTDEVLSLLDTFIRTMENLLSRDYRESAKHMEVRDKLKKHLPAFQQAMREVRCQFPLEENQRAAKKARTTSDLPMRLSTPRSPGYVKQETVED